MTVLAFVAFVAIGMAEAGLGVLLPSIRESFGLSPAAVSLLFLTQMCGYVAAAFASGVMTDRLGLGRLLMASTGLLAAVLVVYAMAPVFAVLAGVGALLGLAIGFTDASVNTYVARHQSGGERLGQLHAAYGLGALAGPAVATTLLLLDWHWRSIYLVLAAVPAIDAGLLLLLLRRQGFPPEPATPGAGPSIGSDLRMRFSGTVTHPFIVLGAVCLAVAVGVEVIVGAWAYTVEHVARGVPVNVAGYAASAYWVGMTIARLSMGAGLKRWGPGGMLRRILAVLLLSLLGWQLLEPPLSVICLPLIGLGLGAVFPVVIYLVPRSVEPPLVSTAIGMMTSVASLGASIGPSVAGLVAQRAGFSWVPAVAVGGCVLLCFVSEWLLRRSRRAPVHPVAPVHPIAPVQLIHASDREVR